MIGILLALAAQASTQPQPRDDPAVKCAFDHARQLAPASDEQADSIADKVVRACVEAESGDASTTESTRFRVRAAAIAMVNRQRGLDGLPADAPLRVPVVEHSLQIPDEIAPAVVPYMECLVASAGIRLSHNGHDLPPVVAKGADCSGQRRIAARRADDMLRQAGGKTVEERRAFIEATLTNVEAFERASMPRPPQSDTHASN